MRQMSGCIWQVPPGSIGELWQSKFRTVIHGCPIGVAIVRASDTIFVDVNESFEKTSGYKRQELVGKKATQIKMLFGPGRHKIHRWLLSSKSARHGQRGQLVTKGGTVRFVSCSAIPLRQEKHLVIFLNDETEQQVIEKRLRELQRMEAISLLASGCAHDFNNLLTSILGHTELLFKEAELHPKVHERLTLVRDSAVRARELTAWLHRIAGEDEPVIVNVSEQIKGLQSLLASIVGERVRLEYDLAHSLGPVKVHATLLRQTICNLATNGSEAMPKGGILRITTRNLLVNEGHDAPHPLLRPGTYVRVTVADSGHGMDRRTASRIFEPFFTTKKQGPARGLGLAATYGIVKQAGGFIFVQSKPQKGSIFSVFLPVAQGAANE